MCRWLAYSGSPVLLDALLYKPEHSLIDQSLHAQLGVETTNGDGFGVGWYSGEGHPGIFRGIGPAWNNQNLRNICAHISAPIVLAHIRAATGTPVQETNSHPFQFDQWLWMHNGSIAQFHRFKRELTLAVDPELYPFIQGSTDSETMFYLALTFGLRKDPPTAVARMAGFIEKVAQGHGVDNALQMTVATSDGDSIWSFRYSTSHHSRSLFYSTNVQTLRLLYPDNPALQAVSDETRLIVSEPLGDLPGVWNVVPESTYGVIKEGDDIMANFRPEWP
ncbi:MAG TPA: class II glutamine amidotransferase [Candidatus Limnocylindrales bacterium]|nr:class II glutamine amidotransferase [Candidatus Limnocylindrales bacterium]